jgi:hypothetical protein
MQITRNEKQFEPISITLESQMEVDALVDTLYLINANTTGSNEGTRFISGLSRELNEYASNKHKLVYYNEPYGSVKVKAK